MDINKIGYALNSIKTIIFTAHGKKPMMPEERKYIDYNDALIAMRALFAAQEEEHKKELIEQKDKLLKKGLTPFFEVGQTVQNYDGQIGVVLERKERISQVGNQYYNYRVSYPGNEDRNWIYGANLAAVDVPLYKNGTLVSWHYKPYVVLNRYRKPNQGYQYWITQDASEYENGEWVDGVELQGITPPQKG